MTHLRRTCTPPAPPKVYPQAVRRVTKWDEPLRTSVYNVTNREAAYVAGGTAAGLVGIWAYFRIAAAGGIVAVLGAIVMKFVLAIILLLLMIAYAIYSLFNLVTQADISPQADQDRARLELRQALADDDDWGRPRAEIHDRQSLEVMSLSDDPYAEFAFNGNP